jgi:hypothetical protein
VLPPALTLFFPVVQAAPEKSFVLFHACAHNPSESTLPASQLIWHCTSCRNCLRYIPAVISVLANNLSKTCPGNCRKLLFPQLAVVSN